jgi:hypothetical protein
MSNVRKAHVALKCTVVEWLQAICSWYGPISYLVTRKCCLSMRSAGLADVQSIGALA